MRDVTIGVGCASLVERKEEYYRRKLMNTARNYMDIDFVLNIQ